MPEETEKLSTPSREPHEEPRFICGEGDVTIVRAIKRSGAMAGLVIDQKQVNEKRLRGATPSRVASSTELSSE